MVPAWRDAIDAGDRDLALAIRTDLVRQIEMAIDGAVSDICCPEPSSEEIYDELRPIDGLEGLAVRLGDWRGAGVVLAWNDGKYYHHRGWPEYVDITDVVEDCRISAADAISDAVEDATSKYDSQF